MKGLIAFIAACLLFSSSVKTAQGLAEPSPGQDDWSRPQQVQDLAYGDILFDYFRGNKFAALSKILVAKQRGELTHHLLQASLLESAIYLDFNMLESAKSLLGSLYSQSGRQQTILAELEFYLGKLYYLQENDEAAAAHLEVFLQALKPVLADGSQSSGPKNFQQLNNEALIILANLATRRGQLSQASEMLQQVSEDSELKLFALYNLGVIWLQQPDKSGNEAPLMKAKPLFQQILDQDGGNLDESDWQKNLQDKSCLALGYFELSRQNFSQARAWFSRVRLSSTLVNQAILGTGWSYLGENDQGEAILYFSQLNAEASGDLATDEAALALAFARQSAGDLGGAISQYQHAARQFNQAKNRLGQIKTQLESHTWQSLDNQSQVSFVPDSGGSLNILAENWLQGFSQEHQAEFVQLIADQGFNHAFDQFQQLEQMQKMANQWTRQIPAMQEMIKVNQSRYQQKLPQIDAAVSQLELLPYQTEMYRLGGKIAAVKKYLLADDSYRGIALDAWFEAPRPVDDFTLLTTLASQAELEIVRRVGSVEKRLQQLPSELVSAEQFEKLRRAKGVLSWKIESQKVDRIWQLEKQFYALQLAIADLDRQKQKMAGLANSENQRIQPYQAVLEEGYSELSGLSAQIEQQKHAVYQSLKSKALTQLAIRESRLDALLLQADWAVAKLQQKAMELNGLTGSASSSKAPAKLSKEAGQR